VPGAAIGLLLLLLQQPAPILHAALSGTPGRRELLLLLQRLLFLLR
jgi:hypothetical protein